MPAPSPLPRTSLVVPPHCLPAFEVYRSCFLVRACACVCVCVCFFLCVSSAAHTRTRTLTYLSIYLSIYIRAHHLTRETRSLLVSVFSAYLSSLCERCQSLLSRSPLPVSVSLFLSPTPSPFRQTRGGVVKGGTAVHRLCVFLVFFSAVLGLSSSSLILRTCVAALNALTSWVLTHS